MQGGSGIQVTQVSDRHFVVSNTAQGQSGEDGSDGAVQAVHMNDGDVRREWQWDPYIGPGDLKCRKKTASANDLAHTFKQPLLLRHTGPRGAFKIS